MSEQIATAVKILNQGGIGIFPTDTAFGIGCRLDDEHAIQRLFHLRKRPQTKATPVLVSSDQMAQNYWQSIPKAVKDQLIDKYWPGALTIVLPCQTDKIPSLARGGGNTVGLRMPNHPTALELIKNIGVPLLGPSANFAGEKTPYSLQEVDKHLLKLVDFVVEGECTIKQASTVIDCTTSPWHILRQGAITIKSR